MLWDVDDNGRMMVRLRSTGASAKMLDRDDVNRYVAHISDDLSATLGIDIVTNELRISFSKTRPEINVTWRAQVPVQSVPDVRTYMVGMSQEAPGE